jgi:hypothetical protein
MARALSVLANCCILVTLAVVPSDAQSSKNELKDRLTTRYPDNSYVQFLQQGLYVGEYEHAQISGGVNNLFGLPKYDMSTKYFHFHESLDPAKYRVKSFTPLDDGRTFQALKGGYGGDVISPLDEAFRIIELRMENDRVIFFLQADQMKHGGARATSPRRATQRGNTVTVRTGQWGVEYHFVFPKQIIEAGDYDAMVGVINKVLLPTQEAASLKRERAGSQSSGIAEGLPAAGAPKVEIKVGMSRQDLIRALGEPLQSITAGTKEILKYRDMSIVIEDGKVADIKM